MNEWNNLFPSLNTLLKAICKSILILNKNFFKKQQQQKNPVVLALPRMNSGLGWGSY